MGAGGSAAKGAVHEIKAASKEQLRTICADLSEEERQRVLQSLEMQPKLDTAGSGLPVQLSTRVKVDRGQPHRTDLVPSLELSKHAEARTVSAELFDLMDQDRSRKISKSEFAVAQRIVAEVSAELLPVAISELDENADGEVDRAEWDQWMSATLLSLGPEAFLDVSYRSLRRVRDAFGDGSRLHPWIDLDFSSLGEKRQMISGADKRGITLPQLRKLMSFLARHADDQGNLRGWWDRLISEPLCTAKINLYSVADWIIKPFTAKAACSFVELVVDEGTVEQTPQWFISHWWGEPVRDFVASVEAHAAAQGVEASAAYWVCA